METIVCKHQAGPKSLTLGADVEECAYCHQQVRYSPGKYHTSHPTVIHLGRIGDKIVLPDPSHKLELTPEDLRDLRAAGGASAPEEKPEKQVIPEIRPAGIKARQKWYRKYRKPMIHDLLTLGEDGFIEKWGKFGIKSRMISHLKSDPYYKRRVEKSPPQPPQSRGEEQTCPWEARPQAQSWAPRTGTRRHCGFSRGRGFADLAGVERYLGAPGTGAVVTDKRKIIRTHSSPP